MQSEDFHECRAGSRYAWWRVRDGVLEIHADDDGAVADGSNVGDVLKTIKLKPGDDPEEIAEDALAGYYPPQADRPWPPGPINYSRYPNHPSHACERDGGPVRRSEFMPEDPYAREN